MPYDMTNKERALYRVLINPDNLHCTYQELADLADVSKGFTFGRMKKDKKFMDFVNKTVKENMKSSMYKIYMASAKSALEDRGFQDRKLLLTIFDDYSDRMEQTGDMGITVEWANEDE